MFVTIVSNEHQKLHLLYTGNIWQRKNWQIMSYIFAKIFLTNIHRCTENVFGICTDCSLFTKFSLPIAFIFMACQIFPLANISHIRYMWYINLYNILSEFFFQLFTSIITISDSWQQLPIRWVCGEMWLQPRPTSYLPTWSRLQRKWTNPKYLRTWLVQDFSRQCKITCWFSLHLGLIGYTICEAASVL